jgi:hypothetical protein
MYTEEDRYSGHSDDSFGFKFSIFLDNCKRASIPTKAQGLAFPIMLTGLAKDYYYKSCRTYRDIDQLCEVMYKRFETDEQGRLNLLIWETLTLNDTIKKNPNKPIAQCLDILIKQITTIQRNLPMAYHADKILCDKLINACRTNEACKFACYKAGNTLVGIISDLQASITTHEQSRQPTTAYNADTNLDPDPDPDPNPDSNTDVYYIDRRYQGLSRAPPKFKPRYQLQSQHKRQYRQPRDQAKKCLVCHKYGCWSTNHTPAERQEAMSKMKD